MSEKSVLIRQKKFQSTCVHEQVIHGVYCVVRLCLFRTISHLFLSLSHTHTLVAFDYLSEMISLGQIINGCGKLLYNRLHTYRKTTTITWSDTRNDRNDLVRNYSWWNIKSPFHTWSYHTQYCVQLLHCRMNIEMNKTRKQNYCAPEKQQTNQKKNILLIIFTACI